MGVGDDTWEDGTTHRKTGRHMGRRDDTWEDGTTHGKTGRHMGRPLPKPCILQFFQLAHWHISTFLPFLPFLHFSTYPESLWSLTIVRSACIISFRFCNPPMVNQIVTIIEVMR